ncbi:hypothetical protein AVEN_53527-1 [Araneus ventricosus]|uniref:Uncharacterized protein n=1 Tax=Araneus ventricosus TaxID=182803 RepID=A0A4Y2RQV6_ARAVE|nr:hypothetical protein AVEN_53527-1 [Araneus ventricosus]
MTTAPDTGMRAERNCSTIIMYSTEYLPPAGGLPPILTRWSPWRSVHCRDECRCYELVVELMMSRDRLDEAGGRDRLRSSREEPEYKASQ